MKNKKIVDAWNRANPDAQAKERIYGGIMDKLKQERARSASKLRWKFTAPAAACMLALTAAAAIVAPRIARQTENEPAVAPEIAYAEVDAILYVPLEEGGLKEVQARVKGTPDALLNALSAHGVVPAGLKFNSFTIDNDGVETNHGDSVSYAVGDKNSAKADFPGSLIEYLNGLSLEHEGLVVEALIKTFAELYRLDYMEITIDGEDFITGRSSYAGQIECGGTD